jgi:hypothetical protein
MVTRAGFVVLLCFCIASPGGTPSSGNAPQQTASQGDSRSNSGTQAISAEDVQGLRDDLAKMRALVQQMDTNLTFVDTTQSPLKHQFQLEIDMWRLMIRRMEKRLQGGAR